MLADLALVLGIAIGVHEDDRDRVEAVALCARASARAHGVEIGRAPRPFRRRARARRSRSTLGVELLRLDDVAREDVRPRLVADLQRVAEAARRHQQRAFAAPLEQRVGRDGGAHLDDADRALRDRPRPARGRGGRGSPAPRRRRRRGSPTAACARAGGRRGSRPITSVKVPPRSIQKSQRRRFRASPPRSVITLASFAAALLWHGPAPGSILIGERAQGDSAMEMARFGKTGMKVSRLCLGCMTYGSTTVARMGARRGGVAALHPRGAGEGDQFFRHRRHLFAGRERGDSRPGAEGIRQAPRGGDRHQGHRRDGAGRERAAACRASTSWRRSTRR